MKKNWFMLVLCSTLAIVALGACSGNNTDGDNAGGPVTLKFYTWYDEQGGNWEAVKAAYKKVRPEVTIEIINGAANDSEANKKQLDLAVASGEDLDILNFSNKTEVVERAALGMFEPLDTMLAKDNVDIKDEYILDPTVDGVTVALPTKFFQYFVLVNEDEMVKKGIAIPDSWTWEEYLEVAQKLTQGSGTTKMWGTYFHSWENYSGLLAVQNQTDPNNADVLKADGSSNVMSPEIRKSFELRWRAEKDLKAATPYSDMLSQKLHYRSEFYNKRAATIITGSWMTAGLGGYADIPATFRIAVAPYPKNKVGDPNAAPADGDFLAVYSGSKHKQEAYDFIRWFSTEGMIVQAKELSAWKKADLNTVIDNILASAPNPEFANKESLIKVLRNTVAAAATPPFPYIARAQGAIKAEFEKYILGQSNLDQALADADKAVQAIAAGN